MEWWLHTDILDEVLLRLPVKTLLRCKAVCKSWCGLIETKSFIKRHYCHESNEERLVFNGGDYVDGGAGFAEGNNDRLRLPYLGRDFQYLLGPVNGILCEVGWRGDIVLLNPATRKVKLVPRIPHHHKLQDRLHVKFGFGYDASSEDYKIAVFYTRGTDVFAVYKASSDSWKDIDVDDSGVMKLMHEGEWYSRNFIGGFWNGVYYWVVMNDRYCKGMFGFDMKSEEFREVKEFPSDEVVGDLIRVCRHGDSMAVLMMDNAKSEFCRVVVRGKEGGWRKYLTETLRIKELESLYPLCVWKDRVLVLKVSMAREIWMIREYYLFHLSSPAAAASSSSSTPKTGFVRLPYFDTALVSASFVQPFSYKESLFAI